MNSFRRSTLTLVLAFLMVTLPWTVLADSSTAKTGDEGEQISVNATENVHQNRVDVDINFTSLSLGESYEYTIYFTRVDPDFIHHEIDDSFYCGGGVHNVSVNWTPDQQGPWTVTVELGTQTQHLVTADDTFGWGNVWENSGDPIPEISASPESTHYDYFGNSSIADNVTISIDAVGTENGADYKLKWKLYQGTVEDGNLQIGVTEGALHRTFTMRNLGSYWVDETNFTLVSWLYRLDSGESSNQTEVQVGQQEWMFKIGEKPEVVIEPVIPGCMDSNATNYDPTATEDDGSCEYEDEDGDGIYDHLEIDGCTDTDAINFDANATDDDGTCEYLDSDEDGVFDHLEIEGCTDKNATNYNQNATEEDGTCEYLDTDEDGIFDYLEVPGCTDNFALNFEIDATDDDGSCAYPAPLSVTLNTNRTSGDAPLSISFSADTSGGREPIEVLWNFGDGATSDQAKVNHVFSAGVYTVILQITDDNDTMVEHSVPIIASEPPVIDDLSGYLSNTGQLDPLGKGVATFEFTATISGGEGPYTYAWRFGDNTSSSAESPVLHEYASMDTYTVQVTVEDSEGRTLILEEEIVITDGNGEGNGIIPILDELSGEDGNFDLYATGTGVIGLLLIFGLFGRKRRESFLEAERRKARGEGSIWDD